MYAGVPIAIPVDVSPCELVAESTASRNTEVGDHRIPAATIAR